MSPRNHQQDIGQQIGDAAAQNPGKTALIGLLSSPLALRAGGVALRWARRHPVLAIAAAAGAYAWYRRANAAQNYGGYGSGTPTGPQGSTMDFGATNAGSAASMTSGAAGATGSGDAWAGGTSAGSVGGGTPGLGAASGPSPTGIGGRASGVTGDADGWSGGRAGGTIHQGQGIAGSGASAPSPLR